MNKEIIKTLSLDQKCSIICNLIKTNNELSFSFSKLTNISYNLPRISSLATAWNKNLLEQYGQHIGYLAKKDNNELFFVDENLYSNNKKTPMLSEDYFLSGNLLASYIKGLEKNINTIVDGLYLNDNLPFVDKEINERVIIENFYRQVEFIIKNGNPTYLLDASNEGNKELSALFSKHLRTYVKFNKLINKKFDINDFINFKELGLNGSIDALMTLFTNYQEAKNQLENQKITQEEFSLLEKDNKIINPEILDSILEKLIDLKDSINSKINTPVENDKETIEKLKDESVVLLKNEQLCLPLQGVGTGYIILDNAHSSFTLNDVKEFNKNIPNVKLIYGYNSSKKDDKQFSKSLISKVKKASFVVLPLYDSCNNSNIELLTKLMKTKAKIVCVCDKNLMNFNFDQYCNAIIQQELKTLEDIYRLIKVLTGKINPSGKLTHSIPYDIEKYNRINRKIGPFIGYKYSDSSNYPLAYPFGYGLSYTTFKLQNMVVSENTVSVDITNTGKYPGYEVLQVYIGKVESKLLKPKKELKGFTKVYLEAGETKNVVIDLDDTSFSYFNIETNKYEIENGDYIVYLGNSSVNTILDCKVKKESSVTPPVESFNINDYIVKTTNIVQQKYSLKEKKKKIKVDSKKVKRSWLLLIFFNLIFLSLFFLENFIHLLTIYGLVNIFLIINLIAAGKKRKQEIKLKQKQLEENLQEDVDFEMLFYENNKGTIASKKVDTPQIVKKEIETEDILHYYNDEYSIEHVASDLTIYCEERGISLQKEQARLILSSMASSKILLINSDNLELVNKFVPIISEFFSNKVESVPYSESLKETNLFYYKDENDHYYKSEIYKGIKYAYNNHHAISLVSVHNVNLDQVNEMMDEHIDNVKGIETVTVSSNLKVNNNIEQIELPKNVWYFIFLNENSNINLMSQKLALNSILINLSLKECKESSIQTEVNSLNNYQFEKIINDSKLLYNVSENQFKKFDLLEEYVSKKVKFSIGNKLNVAMERFFTIYLNLEGEELDAIDLVLKGKLIPLINKKLENVSLDDETLLERLEKIFGEDNISLTSKILK